ncbi:gamma-glutamyltransferase [Aestuariispira insulae]|uniref:Glutathione hydrolase proenzyme n=1 Tax=Aestuariispira insulae TaxID=1461337 RepID=A0A3D9HK90_9PROT|nr:gamma-glutamyltransferase [Aestuariispira insulae]RED49898.1 gamma-glutamyltranspeptidase/glutathione hydrolase [Aestuariispira insulae]
MRNLQLPGRSPVRSPNAMASTSHPLSTQAALDILKKGGNALDAAVAASAVQCVVEPGSTGIGGDCFCLYSKGGSTDLVAYNGSGRAPLAANADWFKEHGIAEIPRQSPHSVTIPGAVDAWDRLVRDHGRLSLGEILQPAIDYARNGYPITSRVAVDMESQTERLAKSKNAARVFLKDGKTPTEGSLHHQKALADSLEKIATEGRDAFYTGEIARDIVSYLQELGGLHTMEDFKIATGEYVTPIQTDYRGHTLYECPPNGQGVIALMLMKIMDGFDSAEDLKGTDPITLERMHQEIEAGRLAYQDRNFFLCDTAKKDMPLDWMLSDTHIDELRTSINPAHSNRPMPKFTAPNHQSTVYITVVDEDRNCCSFINTVFETFGSVLMAPKSGIMLQNRGQGFTLDPDHPNCIEGGKRPLHTIIPGMLAKGGRIVMPFGVMGGQYQAFGHMQFLTRLLDFGLDIQQAMDAPRFFTDPYSDITEVEETVPEEIILALKTLGHEIEVAKRPIGGSQAIWIDWAQGVLTAGSDPRKDGCAMGY